MTAPKVVHDDARIPRNEPVAPTKGNGRRVKFSRDRVVIKAAKKASPQNSQATPNVGAKGFVGAFTGDPSSLISRMRSGTPAKTLPETAGRIGISNERLYEVLRLPSSTIKARISKDQVLAPAEQDRLYRVHRVFERAVQVLEDDDAARQWINRENRALGGESPLSLLDTEAGYELVLDTLARIEYGVYA